MKKTRISLKELNRRASKAGTLLSEAREQFRGVVVDSSDRAWIEKQIALFDTYTSRAIGSYSRIWARSLPRKVRS